MADGVDESGRKSHGETEILSHTHGRREKGKGTPPASRQPMLLIVLGMAADVDRGRDDSFVTGGNQKEG